MVLLTSMQPLLTVHILVPNKFDEEILPQLQQDPQKVVSVQGTGSL